MSETHPFGTMAKGPGGFILCVGCKRLGYCRLGIVTEELLPDGQTITTVKAAADQEGGPGVAHGGWTASVMDEVFGHLAIIRGLFVVTGKLTVEYAKPVPLERELSVKAWVVSNENGRWNVAGEMRLASNGTLLVRANGLFIQRDASHYARFKTWLATLDEN